MKTVRLHAGADHVEDVDVEPAPAGQARSVALQPTRGIVFRSAPPDHRSGFHALPGGLSVTSLSRQVGIGTGDESIRRFCPGGVLLAEDASGRGPSARVVGGRPRDYVFIPLQ